MGFMKHPASVGKENKTVFRLWKSMSHTEKRFFGEECERHGKIDRDRQADKMPNSKCKHTQQKDATLLYRFCLYVASLVLLRKAIIGQPSDTLKTQILTLSA